ncbi:MAG: HAMP domain-containing histidine kinase [Deltaproteobacteria bacterium]|nr:MAG: HAMP domain-containing histidine kinase [Deltaproteobacteria bacterium]
MLSEFVTNHRDEIIARCRARVAQRMAPRTTRSELEQGIPLFLRELEQALEGEQRSAPRSGAATAAVQHGGDLLRCGFTIAQVVHDYGDVCQTITELAIECNAPLSTEELRALNRCLDNAIAEAVTEYARQRELDVLIQGARRSNEHLSTFAHELRTLLASAMLAFDAVRAGSVGIRGSTGDVLEYSLIGLRDLMDRSLTELRLTAGLARDEYIAVGRFLEDIEVAAVLGVHARKLRLTVAEVDPELAVQADRQILSTIISNLLQNAFKYTRPHTHVWLHTHATPDRVLFEIEDQCGGIPPDKSEHLLEPGEPHGEARSGLAMCVRGVSLLRGAIRVRNQNHGCVFTVDLPRSPL